MNDKEFQALKNQYLTRIGDLKILQYALVIVGLVSFMISFIMIPFIILVYADGVENHEAFEPILFISILIVFFLISLTSLIIAFFPIRKKRMKLIAYIDNIVKEGYDIPVTTDMKKHMDERYPKDYIPESQRTERTDKKWKKLNFLI